MKGTLTPSVRVRVPLTSRWFDEAAPSCRIHGRIGVSGLPWPNYAADVGPVCPDRTMPQTWTGLR